MVRMTLKDGERSIHLFEQNNACQLMRKSHFADGEHEVSLPAEVFTEPISRTNGKQQRHWIVHLVLANEVS